MSGVNQLLMSIGSKPVGSNWSVGAELTLLGASAFGESLRIRALTTSTAIATYLDGSYNLWAVVLTVTGNVVTAGTPVTIATSVFANSVSLAVLDSGNVVCFFGNSTPILTCMVLSISGTTVTANSASNVSSGSYSFANSVALSSTKALVAYVDSGSSYVRMNVVTVTGVSCSVGSTYDTFNAGNGSCELGLLSSSTALLLFSDGSDLKGTVATVSGAAVSISTVYSSGTGAGIRCDVVDVSSGGQILSGITYTPGLPSSRISDVMAIAVAGTVVTFGSLLNLNATASRNNSLLCPVSATQFFSWNQDSGDSKFRIVSVSSTTATLIGVEDPNTFTSVGGEPATLNGSTVLLLYSDGSSVRTRVVKI